jgi:type II secretory pathway pseudopilin PulG
MRIFDEFPRPPASGRRGQEAGLSLFEVLVALVVLSLSVGVVMTAAPSQIGRAERAATLKLARLLLQDARYEASLSGELVRVETYAPEFAVSADLADFSVASDVSIAPSGLCQGGMMTVSHKSTVVRTEVGNLTCEVGVLR